MADPLKKPQTTSKEDEGNAVAALQREVWRLRDEVIGLQAELGAARGAQRVAEAEKLSQGHRANYLFRQLEEIRGSREYRIGSNILRPMRRLRAVIRGH